MDERYIPRGIEFDPLDGYHLMMGMAFRPKWRDAPYKRWLAIWPAKTDNGWRWLSWVWRRTRYANRITITGFGCYHRSTVDYLSEQPQPNAAHPSSSHARLP